MISRSWLVLLIVALPLLAASACSGFDDASNTPSPAAPTAIRSSTPSLPTAAATLPPPTPHPQATPTVTPAATATTSPLDNFPTGIASVDAAITAIRSGDVDALARQVAYEKHPCVEPAQAQPLEHRPHCEPGGMTGDLVDGFVVAQCEGRTIPRGDFAVIRQRLKTYVSEPLRFYGVYHTTPTMWGAGTYMAVFHSPPDGPGRAIAAVLNEAGLVGIATGCGASPEELGTGLKPI